MPNITMVIVKTFSDGSRGAATTVGDPDELAHAFKSHVPTPTAVAQGFTMTVQFFPAPRTLKSKGNADA